MEFGGKTTISSVLPNHAQFDIMKQKFEEKEAAICLRGICPFRCCPAAIPAAIYSRCAFALRIVSTASIPSPSPRSVEYVGLEAFVFLCKAHLDGREKLYELRYTVATHRWTLAKEVY